MLDTSPVGRELHRKCALDQQRQTGFSPCDCTTTGLAGRIADAATPMRKFDGRVESSKLMVYHR